MRSLRISLAVALVGLMAPALMAQDRMQQAPPGTVNYVEGAVSMDGQQLHTSAIGSKVMQAGQVLSTSKGRAEILLTPGVFLRIGHNSAVQMVSPDLMKTEVRLTDGRATVEVDSIYKQNHIEIAEDGAVTRLVKQGFYEFNANNGLVRTYDGRAMVHASGNRPVKVRTAHEVMVPPAQASGSDSPVAMQRLRVHHFDRKRQEDSDALVQWSKLRSKYLAQANAQLAYEYAGYPGFEPGWYWNPWGMGYTWIPGYGMYWNPFGWGFYSPVYMSYGYYPYYGYGVARNEGGGRVTPGRNFSGPARLGGGPRGGLNGQPVRAFGVGNSGGFSGAGGGSVGVGAGGGVNLSAGGFGGGGHVSSPAPSGGHGH